MFQDNSIIGSALGPALQAGSKLMAPIHRRQDPRALVLPALCRRGRALKNCEDPKLLGTSKESSLLQAALSFYKTFAIDCSPAQVTMDMFLFSSGYQDVASSPYTTGQTYYYPVFNAARSENALKFAHEFGEVIAMPIMLECITRVRASPGLRLVSLHGNFFV
ncbi:Sec23/Sec24, trunk domain-containing protein, partial [Mycena metata]